MTKLAERYACLYAPEFPAQAMMRLRPELRERACVVFEGDPPMQQVCSCNAKARILGIERGMTRVEVDTFPAVAMLSRSGAEEAAAKSATLECAGTFSPSVEDGSDGNAFLCVLDIAGTEKLHGPPSTLGRSLLDRAGQLGIVSSVAIAGNFHAAICLARGMWSQRRITVIAPGEESAALAPLPLAVLRLCAEQAETFSQWGIHTLGMLAELPERPLIARMGQAGRRLRQLARGELPHLFVPIERAFALEECIELDTPVELLDSLLFVVGAMLDQLIVRANGRVLALASVTATLLLEGGASHSRTVRPALPTNDRQLWIKLLRLDMEAHPPNAAILALRLTAEPGHASKVQLGLFSPQLPDALRFDVTLARIRAVVGEECVGSPVLQDSHRLDDFQMKPFTLRPGAPTPQSAHRPLSAIRQLRPAEEVSVRLQDQRPVSFFFRQKRYEVERAYGPWLAGGEWWGDARWGVQQWDLIGRSHDGTLLCCCLVRDMAQNCWQMAALYD
jgi:protein ImuB